jgi:hypothetical protein
MRKPTCFVVMPYGKRPVERVEVDFDVIYDQLIEPAARSAGFEVVRSDREAASGVIMPRMFSSIYSADLVIADLTYQNPNVYYELGVRHALRAQGTLLIRRTGGDLGTRPLGALEQGATAATAFDIKDVTIWPYQPSHKPDLEMALFSAFTEEHVKLLRGYFDALVDKGALHRPGHQNGAIERSRGAPTSSS